MSAITNINDQMRSTMSRGLDLVKRRVFGANNERLDFLMDSFYKLSPQHQTGVLVGLGALMIFFVLGSFFFYISRVNALESQLNQGFSALAELRSLNQTYEYEEKRYRELMNIINRGSTGFRPKPFFESKANQIGVSITDLRSNDADLPIESPLANDFRNVVVEFRMPKVSVPRLLKFMGEIEKSGKNLSLHSVQIRSRYGDRLYFETNAKVIGFKAGG